MIKNSQRRIRKRQESALARRQENLLDAQNKVGPYIALDEQAIGVKIGIINADIENLAKKGVRPNANLS